MLVLVLALAPVAALIIYFCHKDKFEKEPRSMLIKAFLAGVAISLPICIVESVLTFSLVRPVHTFIIKIFLKSFLIAGLIEEGFKFLAFKWLIYDNNEFDEPYDGILYAVMISLGFAAFENILYVALWTFKLGSLGTYQIGVSRAMFAVPAHAFFGAIMGYYFGLAKFSGNKDAKRMFILKALGYPILAHGLYDFFLFTRTAAGALYMLALFIFCWSFVLKAVKMQVGKSPFKDL